MHRDINELQKYKENREDEHEAEGWEISKPVEKDIEIYLVHIDTHRHFPGHTEAHVHRSQVSLCLHSRPRETSSQQTQHPSCPQFWCTGLIHQQLKREPDGSIYFLLGPIGTGSFRPGWSRYWPQSSACANKRFGFQVEDQMNDGVQPLEITHICSRLATKVHKDPSKKPTVLQSGAALSHTRRRPSGQRSTAPGRRCCRPPAAAPGQRNHTVGIR